MKHWILGLFLTIPLTSAAQTPAGPPPGRPPSGAPAKPSSERMWSKILVQSIKPTLSARNVFVIKGMHANGVAGDWTLETSYKIDDASKAVQITLAAHAPADARTVRNVPRLETTVDIKELAGPAYSGKPGKFDVVVVDRGGKELARTVYEIK